MMPKKDTTRFNLPITIEMSHPVYVEATETEKNEWVAAELINTTRSLFWMMEHLGNYCEEGSHRFEAVELYGAMQSVGKLGNAIVFSILDNVVNLTKLPPHRRLTRRAVASPEAENETIN